MKKILLMGIVSILMTCQITAQNRNNKDIDVNYRRSSVYSLLISHTDKKFNEEIQNCFLQIPTPDSYNNHDLCVKILNIEKDVDKEKVRRKEEPKGSPEITSFLKDNQIASRLVGKWFSRNSNTGECDMSLIQSRGLYAASEIDKAKAAVTVRGKDATLMDAGEDLIQNTFVLVNDITYIDKSKGSKSLGTGLKILGSVAAIATNDRSYMSIGNALGDVAETFKGFSVRVNSSLYQLVWDDKTSQEFYSVWNDKNGFENIRSKFRLKYIGNQMSKGSTTSFMGIREDQPERMIRKACERSLDENIANLRLNFQSFQIKTPLENVEPLEARVGRKEGITEKSLFEVLEPQKDKDGKIIYKKVGEIKPVENLIWDNRYMAEEELAQGATLGCTTFKKVKGSDFLPGYLIRQIK